MDKQIAAAVTEYTERDKRKFNLIFHNVKESHKTDSVVISQPVECGLHLQYDWLAEGNSVKQ